LKGTYFALMSYLNLTSVCLLFNRKGT